MKTVSIAGASGFVGKALSSFLEKDYNVVRLQRGHVDFFDVDSVAAALKGTNIAVYLIHSMLPTARLDQSSFADTDLLLADSFARAARLAGVERIIYLGGLLPKSDKLSKHLESRYEVERALGSHGVPVVALRAGLVIGAEGSSFQIMYLLVKRLPFMLCPKWAWTRTQVISIRDVIQIISYAISHSEIKPGSYDLGADEVLTYRELMLRTARLLKLNRRLLNVPFFYPGLSTLWVCLITGASRKLVAPLVKSMSHEMLVRNTDLIQQAQIRLLSAQQALEECLKSVRPQLRADTHDRISVMKNDTQVRSIQRLPGTWSSDAREIAAEYFRWIGRILSPFISIQKEEGLIWAFRIKFSNTLLLRLKELTASSDRAVYRVEAGLLMSDSDLVQKPAVFEFRWIAQQKIALVGLHGFRPRLPWVIYKYSQAIVHLLIMKLFAHHLHKLSK